MNNRECAVVCCFHNGTEAAAAIVELTAWGLEAWELDEIDDANPTAIWIAANANTDLDQSYFLDRMSVAVAPFRGVVVELDCVELVP